MQAKVLHIVDIYKQQKNQDPFENWHSVKNPHFLSYPHETW